MKTLSSELVLQVEEHRKIARTLREYLTQDQVSEIESSINRLESLSIHLSVFGETNAGKSSLLNSLLGLDNNDPDVCKFKVDDRINTWSDEIAVRNGITWKQVEGLELVIYDTPGIAGDIKDHVSIALDIAKNSDIILYVVFETIKNELQVPIMRHLLELKRPLIIVINQVDLRRPNQIEAIKRDIINKFGVSEEMIVLASGFPIKGAPMIQDLVAKIGLIVEEQKTSLISATIQSKLDKGAVDAVEFIEKQFEAERKKQEVLDRKRQTEAIQLKERADILVDRYSKVAAAAAGVIPFGIDAITSTVATGGMFYHIAKVFEKSIDASTAYKIAKELVSCFNQILFVSTATLAGYLLITKGAKTNPFTYFIGMALDAVFTYFIVSAVGHTFVHFCANDFQWRYKKEGYELMKLYIQRNIKSMFLDRLPSRYRDIVIAKLNPDLLD